MAEEEPVDIEQELEKLLSLVQPNLQDVIKRSFANVAFQLNLNGEQVKQDFLEDTSYFAKNTQVNLSRLELVKTPSFHIQNMSLDLKSMGLSFKCSLGEVNVKGLYSAFNENLYNLIPVMAEGHLLISLSNVIADVNVGLILEDDTYNYINPAIEFIHDEVIVKLSWPSPQKNGGYEFVTTEQLAKHIDDLPLTAAVSLPLYALLRQKLLKHLQQALFRSTSVSDLMRSDAALMEAYSAKVDCLADRGNRILDMFLINVRRTLLQGCKEVLDLPPLHATFLHKIGSTSFVGRLETDTGWVKNLATINRISDVSVARPDTSRTCFRVTLRIKDFQIGFNEYRIKAMGVSCSGRVAAAFADCALNLALTVGITQWEPYAQLDDLRLYYMDGMDLHITGLGPLSSLTPQVRSWVRGSAVAHAAPALARQLQHELHTALAQIPLSDMMLNS